MKLSMLHVLITCSILINVCHPFKHSARISSASASLKSRSQDIPKFSDDFLNKIRNKISSSYVSVSNVSANPTTKVSEGTANATKVSEATTNSTGFNITNFEQFVNNLKDIKNPVGLDYALRDDIETIEVTKASWFSRVWQCIRSPSIRKCIKIFMLQRTNVILNDPNKSEVQFFEDIISAKVKTGANNFSDVSEAEVDKELTNSLIGLMDKRILKFHFLPGVEVNIEPSQNDSIDLAIRVNNTGTFELLTARGMKSKMKDYLPYMLIPAVLMTTILPLVLPGLKMVVMFVMMMNQVAFSMALMNLIRGLIFDPRESDDVVYVNHGYKNEHMEHVQHHQPLHFAPPPLPHHSDHFAEPVEAYGNADFQHGSQHGGSEQFQHEVGFEGGQDHHPLLFHSPSAHFDQSSYNPSPYGGFQKRVDATGNFAEPIVKKKVTKYESW